MENKNRYSEETRAGMLNLCAEVVTELYCSDKRTAAEIMNTALESGGDLRGESELEKMLWIVRCAFKEGARAAIYAQEEDEEALNAALAARIMEAVAEPA